MEQLLARQFVTPVGDDFVGIHIGLGTGASLPDHQGKMGIQCAGDYLIAGTGDGGALFLSHLLWL